VTGKPDASLGGVYKLSEYKGEPRIKLSDSLTKVSLPYKKQVYRMIDANGKSYGADAVTLYNEEPQMHTEHPFDATNRLDLNAIKQEPVLENVMDNGKRVVPSRSASEIAEYSKSRLEKLPEEYKRFQNPHIYKIGLSPKLKQERDALILK